MNEAQFKIGYHSNQLKIFYGSNARYKIIAKGRRFGLTRGLANYVIDQLVEGLSPILWVDTIYGNIQKYFERYFIPGLRELPHTLWKHRSDLNDLKIGNAVCDFRSADKPENIEGFGYALIILNEAGIILKNRRLWEETIRPMTLDYKARVIIGGTPKGKSVKKTKETHLFYELYQKGLKPSRHIVKSRSEISKWESFNFSSYDNPLLDRLEIDELASDISPILREQEIYGKFVEKETSGIINSNWWKYYNKVDLFKNRIFKIVQSWDTAFKIKDGNDFSVCTTWAIGLNCYYVLGMWRDRVEFPELKRKCVELYELYKPNEILIEDKASGQSLIQELQRETRMPIKAVKVDTDKIARVHAITPLIEAGKVLLPIEEDWTKHLVAECEDFPDGEFDDVVDSVSQFLNHTKGVFRISNEPVIHFGLRDSYRRYRAWKRQSKR